MFRFPVVALTALLAVLPAAAGPAVAQTPAEDSRRAIPYPLSMSPEFAAAVEFGSRTLEGVPGPDYTQQAVRYAIEATVDPTSKEIRGSTRIVYRNASSSPSS